MSQRISGPAKGRLIRVGIVAALAAFTSPVTSSASAQDAVEAPTRSEDPSESHDAAAASEDEVSAGSRRDADAARPSDDVAVDLATASAADLADLSLEELLQIHIGVASARDTSIRESPGVLSVLTRRDLEEAGARDLIDALMLVPGFATGMDVQGVVGIGVRGLWGHEGKVLVMLDGVPMNELAYLTAPIGNRFPIALIDRIEIIRGPGSVRYGGYAELAVINIVSVTAPETPGSRVVASMRYGQLAGTYARRGLSLAYAARSERVEGLSYSLSADLGQGHPATGRYTDFEGTTIQLDDENRWDPASVNFGLAYRGLEVRYLFEDYRTRYRDAFDVVAPRAYSLDFVSHNAYARYEWRVNDRVRITPRIAYTNQLPWHTVPRPIRPLDQLTPEERTAFADERNTWRGTLIANRFQGGLVVDWDAHEAITVQAGLQSFVDRYEVGHHIPGIDENDGALFSNEDRTARLWNVAGFAELQSQNRFVNVTAGARFERHSVAGNAFVPRLALSRVFGPFHAKLLYASAFKAPAVMNLDVGDSIRPERLHTVETELGARFGEHAFFVANAFYTRIRRPIVYLFEGGDEGYRNFGRSGSVGAEAELRIRYERARLTANYAYYASPGTMNTVDAYDVPQSARALLGFARQRATFTGDVRLVAGLHLGGTLHVIGPRFAQVGLDEAGDPVLGRLDPAALLNVQLRYEDLGVDGLSVLVGTYNLANAAMPYVQPYASGHPNMPGQQRELFVRVTYDARF